MTFTLRTMRQIKNMSQGGITSTTRTIQDRSFSAMQAIIPSLSSSPSHPHPRQSRSFASESTATVTATSESSSSYEFQHARAKEIYEKMIALPVEEIKLISALINEKLGITITEADKRGGISSSSSDGGAESEAAAAAVEEKTAFDVKLTGFDAKSKIKVIKEIRAITGLGLKEAKALVEEAPKTFKKNLKMEECEELKDKLEAVGATVEIS